MPKTIVAIGGGEIRRLETLPIDEEAVRLTGKAKPHALFVPTASNDSLDYAKAFEAAYGGKLGCSVDTLLLYADRPSPQGIADKIAKADLVYVGGGNTLRMMKLWRRLGVDRLLTEAWEKGAVMSGASAGAICWFQYGNSDSRKSINPDAPLIRVKAMGLAEGMFCPHYHSEKREASFADMMAKFGGVGYAVDDHSALIVEDGRLRGFGDTVLRMEKQQGVVVSRPV